MTREDVVFHGNSATPSTRSVGLHVNLATECDATDDAPVWLHCVMVVPLRRGATEARAVGRQRSLTVCVITEPDQLHCIAPRVVRAPLAAFGAAEDDVFVTSFSFELRSVLPRKLFHCATWVHVESRGLHSTPRRLAHRKGASQTLADPVLPSDHLIAGYDASARGAANKAVGHFDRALAEPNIAEALDCPHLELAATVATNLATSADVPGSLERAAAWRLRHVARRDAALAEYQRRLAQPDCPRFVGVARDRLVFEHRRFGIDVGAVGRAHRVRAALDPLGAAQLGLCSAPHAIAESPLQFSDSAATVRASPNEATHLNWRLQANDRGVHRPGDALTDFLRARRFVSEVPRACGP